jgi:sucrose-phosphate synthase
VKRERLLEKGTKPETIEKRYRITGRIEAEEQALDHAAFVVASTRQEVEEQYGLYDHHQSRRMLVIPPGVDLSRFSPPEARSKNDAPIHQEVCRFLSDPKKPILLALSRADPRKNIPALLRAFGRNERLRERANLVLVAGNRDDLRKVTTPVRRVMTEVLYLIDRYDLYGSIAYPKEHANEEVPDLYRMATRTRGVFVNPALTEPFGLTLLEAAASGLPVVATRDGGPTDIIGTCRNGLLIDPLDPDAMGEALLDAIEDRARWRRWSRQGRRGALKNYSWETHVNKYMRAARTAIQRSEKQTLVFSVKRRLIPADRLLVSDIDNTLIGDGEALDELIELLDAAGDRVAFAVATGRSIALTREALRKWKIPTPTAMITSVGTAIRYGADLVEDRGWERHIEFRWRPDALREAMSKLPGLKLQPKWGQSHRKISYFVDPDKAPGPEAIMRHLRRSKLQVQVIYSHGAYLDLLPIRASKGMALRYFAMRWGIPPERCLVAGDSGNDEEMLVGNTLSVVVGNHEPELERIRGLPRIYFARGEFARGILEGIEHYDFLGNIRVPDLESADDGS